MWESSIKHYTISLEHLGNSGMCWDLGELGRSRTNTPGDTEGWLFLKRQSASAVKRKSNLKSQRLSLYAYQDD